ncbi:hypothetical protein GALMADRAFT_146310 [Galerina marginata CBS 339.88]|uniref:Uncharacterized protein n=1 Tax=Galerina marginata (strain CBS 339.88) TaxID=685588 RepID=A0A067SBQ3_GALM3|nr:hypothetical protein GALMADRAFT_146310 [Galerina marginata CBS 339.88]
MTVKTTPTEVPRKGYAAILSSRTEQSAGQPAEPEVQVCVQNTDVLASSQQRPSVILAQDGLDEGLAGPFSSDEEEMINVEDDIDQVSLNYSDILERACAQLPPEGNDCARAWDWKDVTSQVSVDYSATLERVGSKFSQESKDDTSVDYSEDLERASAQLSRGRRNDTDWVSVTGSDILHGVSIQLPQMGGQDDTDQVSVNYSDILESVCAHPQEGWVDNDQVSNPDSGHSVILERACGQLPPQAENSQAMDWENDAHKVLVSDSNSDSDILERVRLWLLPNGEDEIGCEDGTDKDSVDYSDILERVRATYA